MCPILEWSLCRCCGNISLHIVTIHVSLIGKFNHRNHAKTPLRKIIRNYPSIFRTKDETVLRNYLYVCMWYINFVPLKLLITKSIGKLSLRKSLQFADFGGNKNLRVTKPRISRTPIFGSRFSLKLN